MYLGSPPNLLFIPDANGDDVPDSKPETLLDGWGIHYMLGRGWTYNLWGRDCAKITLGRRIIRVGTDDVKNLVACLREKIRSPLPPGEG